MPTSFAGYVRRIDFEPKNDFLGYRTYAHVFVRNSSAEEYDFYTDDPRLEAAILTAFNPSMPLPPRIEVHYEDVNDVKKIVRVILDLEKNDTPSKSAKK